MTDQNFLHEVSTRRTFAIISHPDAAQPFNA
ncbi:peptide chain release factor 3 [Providencia huaxiensis]|nr:peptide chain release factor 3 [Providencia huaxiensis]